MPKNKKVIRKEPKIIRIMIMFSFLLMAIPTYIIAQYILFGMSLRNFSVTPDKITLDINPVFFLFVLFYWFVLANVHKWVKRRFKNKAKWDDW